MKILFKITALCLLFAVTSCVDDYTDANPPAKKDGPELYVNKPATGAITSTRVDNSVITYITKGVDITFTGLVPDAPGLLDSVSVILSDTVGLVSVTGFDAIKGDEEGEFSIVYTPEPDDGASTFDDNIVSISATVTDAQGLTTAPQVTRVRAVACLPSINLQGFWRASSDGVTSDPFADGSVGAGGDFVGLETLVQLQIRATGGNATVGTNALTEQAGTLFITDASFGLWGAQGYTAPVGRLSFCGTDITGYVGLNAAGTAFSSQGNHAITGQINNDGTITLNYSNDYGESATVTLTRPAPF
jgi:hypothetical protein